MEELQRKLDEIKQGVENIKKANELLEKQADFFSLIEKIDKEVI